MYDENADSDCLSASLDSKLADCSDPKSEKDDLTKQVYTIIPADPNVPRPQIKRYAHHGKRRRSITEDLFRCTFVTKVVSDELSCGALLWKNRPADLRSHLLQHLPLEIVRDMSDTQVSDAYTQAKRIFLEHLPDDAIYGIDEEDLDEEDDNLLEVGENKDNVE